MSVQDEDSTYGGEENSTRTETLDASVYDYYWEHGRSYHAYRVGVYFGPNDDFELDRMDLQHNATLSATRGKLIHAPVKTPQEILDIGAGSGIWTFEVADAYPNTQVYGVDLSPIQPSFLPKNAKIEIDDVESDWTWEQDHFDLIHCRFMLSGSISNFEKLFAQAFRHCKPGGYFEVHDLCLPFGSNHAELPENVQKWCSLMRKGIVGIGGGTFDLDFYKIAEMLKSAGFVDVSHEPYQSPCGRWPKDPDLRMAGRMQQAALCVGIEGLSLAIFTRSLQWPVEELYEFLAEVREDLANYKNQLYLPCAVLYGRKPLDLNGPSF